MHYQSPLGKIIPKAPASSEELEDLRKKAWKREGVLVVRPEQLTDIWTQQLLINLGNELYGKRHGR